MSLQSLWAKISVTLWKVDYEICGTEINDLSLKKLSLLILDKSDII